MTEKLYKFYVDCGRMGDIEGLFVVDESDIDNIVGENVYFGEILGKHSDIGFDIEKEMFTEVDIDEESVNKLVNALGSKDLSGYNPFHYWERADE